MHHDQRYYPNIAFKCKKINFRRILIFHTHLNGVYGNKYHNYLLCGKCIIQED